MKKFILVNSLMLILMNWGIFGLNRDTFVLETGKEDGELYIPVQVKEGPDGNIYAFDAKDAFIKVYSPEGKYLRRMGGRGQGPGEMVRLGTFGFTRDNRLFFTEMINGHRWITFMELSGKYHQVLKLEIPGSFGIRRAKMLSNNRIIAEIHFWGSSERRGNHYGLYYPRWLAIINSKGKIDRIVMKRECIFSISSSPGGPDIRIPFFPEFLWDVTEDGKIIFSDGAGSVLQAYDFNGNVIEECHSSLPEAPEVTAEDLKKWRESVKKKIVRSRGIEGYKRYFNVIEKYKQSLYQKKPIFYQLSITPAGNILVKSGKRMGRDQQRYYWLIDRNGNMLCQLVTNASSVTISKSFILYVTENDEGEPFVHCMIRKGDEKEDLLFFL